MTTFISGSTGIDKIQNNAVDIADLSATGTASASTFLRGDNSWTAVDTFTLPTQSGNAGKFLTTDASTASWATVDALPAQSGNAGKYLTTDASTASWATLDTDANKTTKGLYEHEHTIDADYSIASGSNAMSAGPITIDSGYSVTIPTGSTWVIVQEI